MKVVLVTGGFDPIHSGHIKYLNHAKNLGDYLVVGLNSDKWLTRKKGKPFLSWDERMSVLDNLHMVNEVISFEDSDDSACDAIHKIKERFPNSKIIFANGGDRTKSNIPELKIKDIEFAFGVGGDNKSNSSSQILKNWKFSEIKRPWGHYAVIYTDDSNTYKVKELVVSPGKTLTMQKHLFRGEHWFITTGTATVYTLNKDMEEVLKGVYNRHESLHIPTHTWHRLSNESDTILKIIEVQYGAKCLEEDIERYETYSRA